MSLNEREGVPVSDLEEIEMCGLLNKEYKTSVKKVQWILVIAKYREKNIQKREIKWLQQLMGVKMIILRNRFETEKYNEYKKCNKLDIVV